MDKNLQVALVFSEHKLCFDTPVIRQFIEIAANCASLLSKGVIVVEFFCFVVEHYLEFLHYL